MNWLGALIVAGIGALLADWAGKEVEGWAQRLISLFLESAVARLPDSRRSRLDEEWRACLLDLPSPLSKLLFVVGVRVAAERIRARDRRDGRLTAAPGPLPGLVGIAAGSVAGTLIAPAVAARTKGLLWLTVCAATSMGFYAISVRTAAARREVASLERSIAQARRDIARLEAEVAFRGSTKSPQTRSASVARPLATP